MAFEQAFHLGFCNFGITPCATPRRGELEVFSFVEICPAFIQLFGKLPNNGRFFENLN